MKYVFLINSFTTKDNTQELKSKIESYCKKENLDYIIEINSPTYETHDILKKYEKGKHIIIGIGGDGIINRLLNGIINTDNILGFIPYGTGNDFYKCVKHNFKEELNKCDVAKINDKYFINVTCFGIDADVANNKGSIKSKLIPKSQRYIVSLISTFFKFKCRPFKVEYNNEKLNTDFTTIAVCNGSYYGGGFNISPYSNLQDSLLDVYIAPKMNKLSMLNLILKMKNGKHKNSKHISHIKTDKITITSPQSIKCNVDGEELSSKKFDITLIPNGVTIYYNPQMIEYLQTK